MTSLKVDGISSRTVVADLEYLFEKWEPDLICQKQNNIASI